MPEQSRHCCIPPTFEKAPGTSVVVSDLSPRAWGSRRVPLTRGLSGPSPRAWGSPSDARSECPVGPSPRAWGSPHWPHAESRRRRSIPTCVGLTSSLSCAVLSRGSIPTCVGLTPRDAGGRMGLVHPHVRGAHGAHAPGGVSCGPSPRAWGSPTRLAHFRARGPSPRAWGSRHAAAARPQSGPSPRAWGSRARRRSPECRSIPTCVGLTIVRLAAALTSRGPSPRAWGSRRQRSREGTVHPHVRGAHDVRGKAGYVRGVHPHVRGAHDTHGRGCAGQCGPSPRAWGSR